MKSEKVDVLLFGIPGSGKSFIGEQILRDQLGFYFHDATADLTPTMLENLATNRPHSMRDRDEFCEAVIHRTLDLMGQHPKLVVAHFFPFEKHRVQIKQEVPGIEMVYVKAPIELVAQRVPARQGHILTTEQALQRAAIFEEPRLPHFVIDNNGDRQHAFNQVNTIIRDIRFKRNP